MSGLAEDQVVVQAADVGDQEGCGVEERLAGGDRAPRGDAVPIVGSLHIGGSHSSPCGKQGHGQPADAGAQDDLEGIGAALNSLGAVEPRLAQLVDLKFFCGFSFAEIAELLGTSERTAQRDWDKARILLRRYLGDQDQVSAADAGEDAG